MKKPQHPEDLEALQGRVPASPLPSPATTAWEDSSGEGAASALQSLKKLEQSRKSGRPDEDRPGAN